MQNPSKAVKETGKLLLITLFIVVAGLGVRTYKSFQFEQFEHDDLIGYLAATNNLKDYAEYTDGMAPWQLTSARDWQRFFQVHNSESFIASAAGIATSMRDYDIHPPGYYLWLNIVIRNIDRLTPAVGWFSNIVFYLLNGVLVLFLAFKVSRNYPLAILALFLWCFGAANIDISLLARHYEMCVSAVLVSTLLLFNIMQKPQTQWFEYVSYGLIVGAGYLINYQFLFHIFGLLLMISFSGQTALNKKITTGIMTIMPLVIAVFLYPGIFTQSSEVVSRVEEINGSNFIFRLNNSAEEILKYSVAGVLIMVWMLFNRPSAFKQLPDNKLLVIGGANLGLVVLTYILFITPTHAMGDRYLALAWPFFSIILAQLLYFFWQKLWVKSVVIILTISQAVMAANKPQDPPLLEQAKGSYCVIVSDYTQRGEWPNVFLYVEPDQHLLMVSEKINEGALSFAEEVCSGGAKLLISDNLVGLPDGYSLMSKNLGDKSLKIFEYRKN